MLRQPGTSPQVRCSDQSAGSGEVPSGFGGRFWGESHRKPEFHRERAGLPQYRWLRSLDSSSHRACSEPIDNYCNLDLNALNAACPPGEPFLPCAIRRPEYQAAISAPSLRKIVLTAYDSASSGPYGASANYLDPAFWQSTANRDAVRREYRDLTYALYQTQHDTGKTFVVASWEADNQAYCGSFYSYWIDANFRDRCGDIASRNDAIGAITEWFKVRRAGIRDGRQLAANAGYSGVKVCDGIEFNMNTLTYPTTWAYCPAFMCATLFRQCSPTTCSIRRNDSQFRGHGQDLREIRLLAINSPGAKLAIGEVGFPRHGLDGVDTLRTVETVSNPARRSADRHSLQRTTRAGDGPPLWSAHVRPDPQRAAHLRRELQAQATEIATNPTARSSPPPIAVSPRSVVFPIDSSNSTDRFPNGPFSATALCDGVETPIDVVFQSTDRSTCGSFTRSRTSYRCDSGVPTNLQPEPGQSLTEASNATSGQSSSQI